MPTPARRATVAPRRATTTRKKAPIKSTSTVRITPTTAKNMAAKVNYRSLNTVTSSVKRLKLRHGQIAQTIGVIYKGSATKAEKFSKGMVKSWKNNLESRSQAREMIHWASQAGPKQRRMMCKTFKQSGTGMIMVHGIGELNKTQARRYMKDYFAAGGDLKSVAQYLQIAGQVLRKNQTKQPGTDGGVVDAVGGFIEDAVDTVVDAVTTVVDAVISAGKSLASVVSEAVNWAANKVADLVDALIEAGKSVASILAEAARKGLNALKKFARAVIDAGRRIGEVLAWLVNKAANTIKEVLGAILSAGKSIASIVVEALRYSFTVVSKMVKGLIQLGKRVFDILKAAASQTYNSMRNIVRALLAAGKNLAAVMQDAVKLALGAVRNIVKSLISLGKKVVHILQTVATKTAAIVRNVADALLKAGKTLTAIMASAVQAGVTLVRKMAQAMIQLAKAVKIVIATVINKAGNFIKAAILGILAAGRKIAQIMGAALSMTARALKKVVMAVYQASRKVGEILVSVARRAIGTIRTVLEGLFAVGVQLFNAVASICKDIVSGFRKGFFKGLLEIVKAPLKIFKAALKAGGAILALTFAAFLELWGGYRGLKANERTEARRVFGWSIDLNRVKVTNDSIPADVINYLNGQRPFTTMYVINFSSSAAITPRTLIHELTHVWQAVTAGPVYMVEALHAQIFGEGYTVTDEALANNNGVFAKFNREQQATIVENYWYRRWRRGSDYQKYQPYARAVYRGRTSGRVVFNLRAPVTGRRVIPAVRIPLTATIQ